MIDDSLSIKNRKTCFLYARKTKKLGSTVLRGSDISKLMDCEILELHEAIELKNRKIIALKCTNYDILIKLSKENEIILDMVDHKTERDGRDTLIFKHFDYAIFTSNEQLQEYKNYFKFPNKCVVIYHHWDPRLKDIKINNQPTLKIGYIGTFSKCNLYGMCKDIDYHEINNLIFMKKIHIHENYNSHYIVKPEKHEKMIQPMTKLANASALGCPVIVYKGKQYIELLTEEYPYYCDGFDMKSLLKTIEYMKHTYQKEEWHKALEILKEIKVKTCLETVIEEYKKI